jgi:molecular chaperone DnaK
VHNEADAMVFRAEKALNEYKDKIPQQIASEVSGKIDALKKALEGKDISRIRAAKEELERSMQHIGEAMAKGGAAGGAGAHAESSAGGFAEQREQQQQQQRQQGKGPNDIEEAEVEIIDDNNKPK